MNPTSHPEFVKVGTNGGKTGEVSIPHHIVNELGIVDDDGGLNGLWYGGWRVIAPDDLDPATLDDIKDQWGLSEVPRDELLCFVPMPFGPVSTTRAE